MTEPHDQPPPLPPNQPLNYLSPQPADPRDVRLNIVRFCIGLVGGGLVSGLFWIGGWRVVNDGNGFILIAVVPGVKILVGITLLCLRGWRTLGAGILVSIALGLLIFVGSCFGHL